MGRVKRSDTTLVRYWLALPIAVVAAAVAQAQTLRVELRDSVSRAPVIGALVNAADSTGRNRVDGLTNDRGAVTLRLPAAGTYALSVRRIGLQPRRVTGVTVADGAMVTLPLMVSGIRQMLSAVRVVADAGVCGRAPAGENRTAMLWEQISLALRASTLSRDDSAGAAPLRIAERVRELSESLEERAAKVTRSGYGAGRPYSAVHPDTLAAHGYVRREADGDISFFAPDETVLLSESFLATHCFDSPKEDEDPSLAELRFRPARGRKVPEVEGTAFVDTLSGELRRLEFRFVNTKPLLPMNARYAGGDVALLRLANGQWIVTSWAIRMPVFSRIGYPPIVRLTGYREVGGTVDPVENPPPD
jgi:hypothetical protein